MPLGIMLAAPSLFALLIHINLQQNQLRRPLRLDAGGQSLQPDGFHVRDRVFEPTEAEVEKQHCRSCWNRLLVIAHM